MVELRGRGLRFPGEGDGAPHPLVTWGILLIGFAAVAVPLTDPVWRLSDEVRLNGPIIVSVDSAPETKASTPLPPTIVPRSGETAEADPAAEIRAALAVIPGPVATEHDAHVWLWLAETAEARERALALDRAARIEVQRRLALMGYDPQGIDGVLGPLSRSAITAWQRDFGFAQTGHLDEAVIASIEERSVERWAEWEAERALRQRHAARPLAAPDATAEPAERAACIRGSDGRIVERQSFGCDLKGVKEGFQRLLAKIGSAPEAADGLPGPGAER